MSIIPVREGEYCPRSTKSCEGESCNDYLDRGCRIYFKIKEERKSRLWGSMSILTGGGLSH